MSNDKPGENPGRRKPKVSCARVIRAGLAGPKPRPKGVGDGERVNIPVLPRWSGGGTEKDRSASDWKCWCKPVGGLSRKKTLGQRREGMARRVFGPVERLIPSFLEKPRFTVKTW